MSSGAERREYFRIGATLRVRTRLVPPGRRAALVAEIRGAAEAPSDLDPELTQWLQRIESRLELLLEHFQLGEGPSFRDEDTQHVMLSGAGLRLNDPGDAVVDQERVIDLEIPEVPPRHVRALARIVQLELRGEDGTPQVALAFSLIREPDRDAIVAHALELERRHRRASLEAAS